MQEKIQFILKGDGATRLCRGHPSESPSLFGPRAVSGSPHVYHNALMFWLSIQALGLFPGCTIRLHSRLRGGGPCGALRCWPRRNQCYKCGQPRSASSCPPRSSTYLDTHGAVGGMPEGFPSSSFFGGGASPWPFLVSSTWFSTSQPGFGSWPFRSWSTS